MLGLNRRGRPGMAMNDDDRQQIQADVLNRVAEAQRHSGFWNHRLLRQWMAVARAEEHSIGQHEDGISAGNTPCCAVTETFDRTTR